LQIIYYIVKGSINIRGMKHVYIIKLVFKDRKKYFVLVLEKKTVKK